MQHLELLIVKCLFINTVEKQTVGNFLSITPNVLDGMICNFIFTHLNLLEVSFCQNDYATFNVIFKY